jgi:hypothetical protein
MFFFVKSHQITFYTYVMKVYINFRCKKKNLKKKIIKLNDILPLTNTAVYKVSKCNQPKPTKTEHVFK